MILRMMRYFSGRSASTGLVLSATGLYFRFAAKVEACSIGFAISGSGTRRVGNAEYECGGVVNVNEARVRSVPMICEESEGGMRSV
jgi:hypothetical protein